MFYKTRTDPSFVRRQEDLQRIHESRIRAPKARVDSGPPKKYKHMSKYHGNALVKQIDQKERIDDYNYCFYHKLEEIYKSPSAYS